ncbi:MAG: tryptophan-rich sensory protein [Propionibacteriaceae bacterium]|jgi:tryptophan-rich sensory protein|nr:tryptophan-rich sensory protein [Propionibacteriaceae bacterium]
MKQATKIGLTFLGLLILIEAIGGLSALLAGDIAAIYADLTKPALSPPAPLFGIVWPILYGLMALSLTLYIFSTDRREEKKPGLILFIIQLLLNFVWSIIFFAGGYWIGAAIIIVLDIIVAYLVVRYAASSRWAAIALAPYLIWILFATYLTFGVAVLN